LNFTVVCSSVSATVAFNSFKIVENDTLKGNKFLFLQFENMHFYD
jgi:hypothetical protein